MTDAETENQSQVQREERPKDTEIVQPGLPTVIGSTDVEFRRMGRGDAMALDQVSSDWAADHAGCDQSDGVARDTQFHRIRDTEPFNENRRPGERRTDPTRQRN